MSVVNLKKVINYLPLKIRTAFENLSGSSAENITEIRLRVNSAVSVSLSEKNLYITSNGGFTLSSALGIMCTQEDLTESFNAVCDYSQHAYENQISQGFITIKGGNRVGFCGTAVYKDGKVQLVKKISSINFRIAGQSEGCSRKIIDRLFSDSVKSVLVVGIPLSGKTTILRDICRILGSRHKICIIDERSEIAASYQGIPQNKIGNFTDVFNGYDKKNGIEIAVRVMSPELIVCDEIGGSDDCNAILQSVNSGVKFIASVHGQTLEEVFKREHIRKLYEYGVFEYAVLLDSNGIPGIIKEIRKIGECI